MCQFFPLGGQIIGDSASTLVLSMNSQDLFSLAWTGFISLPSKGLPRAVLHYSLKASILCYSAFFMVQLSHALTISGKTIALTIQTFAGKVKSLIFSILSGFSWLFFQGATIFFFFPQLQSLQWLWSPGKSVTVFIVFPGICHEVMELDATIFIFWSVHTTSISFERKTKGKRQNGCLRRPYK